ncbi:hypothetical protein HNV12_01385 [Methanococcoides sp. SA1]|nr:hypothetical protein [Methanococcoides sp. SA1]
MLFNRKKKDMVDLRELQKRGVVRIPRKNIVIPTNSEGFVEMSNSSKSQELKAKSSQSNADFFGFMDNSKPEQSFSTESDGYSKREVDTKVSDLDNKIYKLEQRIELLEKKLDVNQPINNVGAMGW